MPNNEIFKAIEEQEVRKLDEMLSKGRNPNETEDDWCGWTPLHHAVDLLEEGGSLEVINILIKNGADVNKWNRSHTSTPLILAVFNGNIEAAKILLEAGADPNAQSGQGDTPLRYSVQENNYEMVTLLLEHGASKTINKFGGDMGLTALGIAASQLDIKMIKLLIHAGADLSIRDDEHKTAQEHVPKLGVKNRKEWETAMKLLKPQFK
jgi:ankyrin repeat protein